MLTTDSGVKCLCNNNPFLMARLKLDAAKVIITTSGIAIECARPITVGNPELERGGPFEILAHWPAPTLLRH